jgi:glycolate oxidase iron-sulfur subunit
MDPKTLVDYAASLDCIHCGLCLRTCPTYQLTGNESSSPRGRVYLMRAVAEGALDPREPAVREEMDFCLVCRHCESVCPAGVRFGEMMETMRHSLGRLAPRRFLERALRRAFFGFVLPSRARLDLAFALLRLAQVTGLARLAARIAGDRGRALAALPRVPPASERRRLPAVTPARGERRGTALVLEGCVQRVLFGRVNRATVEVLSSIGVEPRVPRGHSCCGALHAHNGDLEGARALARETIAAFEATQSSRDDAVAVNSAGCGAHMKAYGHLLGADPAWKERAERFAARVKDFSEFVAALAPGDWRPRLPADALPGSVTYDDPCHLCHGQRIRDQPRALLDRVEGLARVEMPSAESCCGSAGIYSLARPRDSRAIFEKKRAELDASGARVLVTANPGCQVQWETGLALAESGTRVMHLAEVLALASGARDERRE